MVKCHLEGLFLGKDIWSPRALNCPSVVGLCNLKNEQQQQKGVWSEVGWAERVAGMQTEENLVPDRSQEKYS